MLIEGDRGSILKVTCRMRSCQERARVSAGEAT